MILLTHAKAERDVYYPDEALTALRAIGEVRLNETGRPLAGAELIAMAADCAVIIGDIKAIADAETFAALPDLIAYVHGHVDLRRVDVAAASAQGVLVTHASAGFGSAVAELVIAFMIDLARGITSSTSRWRAGQEPPTTVARQVSGSTLGIVGYGHIGRQLARVARSMDMRVLVHDPYVEIAERSGVESVSFENLLETADFVVPLAPSTSETANLFSEAAFARMKRSAFLINVSRGDLIDEAALERALDNGTIAGAALDVGRAPFQMPPNNLAVRNDVIATPHIGGVTFQAVLHQAMDTVWQTSAILSGRIPEGAVNASSAHRMAMAGSA